MKPWKIILIVLAVLLVLLPSAVLVYVASSESGLRTAARIITNRDHLGPVKLRFDDVSGTLTGGAHFGRVVVVHRNADIDARNINARVSLWSLLARRIHVIDLRVGDLKVDAHRIQRTGSLRRPRFLAPLMTLDFEDAQLAHGLLTMPSGQRHEATHAIASATIYPRMIRVREARIDLPLMAVHARAVGRLHARRPIGFDGRVDIDYQPANLAPWDIAAEFDGNQDELPLRLVFTKPFRARVIGTARDLNDGRRFEGRARIEEFSLVPFGGGDALGKITGSLVIGTDSSGIRAQGTLDPAGLASGPFEVRFSGDYEDRHLEIFETQVIHPESKATVTAKGSVTLKEGGGQHVELAGDWTQFRWPLVGSTPSFNSPRGAFTLSGDKPWEVTARGDLVTEDLPETPFWVNGTLEPERFVIADSGINALRGEARIKGEVRWNPAESWSISGHATGMDPAAFRPDLPGRLDFDFSARGAPFGEKGSLDLSVQKIQGRLRGQELRGGGRISRPAEQSRWRFDDVDLRLGRARLQLDGTLATGQRDLNFVIDAEDLSLLDPEARGRLNARGRIAGSDKAPLLRLTARGTDFEWQSVKMDALSADVDINLAPGGKTEADVQLRGLLAAGRAFPSSRLTVAGNTETQKIGIVIDSAQVRTNLEASGGFTAGTWRGEIRTLGVRNDRDLNLNLERAAPLTFSMDSAQVQELCLVGATARSCVSGRRDPQTWNVVMASTQLPLAALTAGLTADVQYYGTINLDAHAEGGAGRKATGELHGDLKNAELRHQLSNKRVETMALGNGRVDALAEPDELSISVGLDAGPSGSIRGNLSAQRNTEDWQDHPIKGELDLTTDGLGVLDIYLGGIDRASGRLTTRVTVDGTLGEPRFDGLLQLRNAEIDIFRVNMMLRDLSMDAHFSASGLDLDGHSALGGGTVNFKGNLAWRDREPYGELRITGQNLLVADVPEARVEASPDLLFKVSGHRIDASGKVLLPNVRLEPADLTDAALASGDEVMIGAPPVDPASRWTVVSDIRVELGDHVNLDAFGLTARLGGALDVRTDEFGITRGQGELAVAEGSYAAFGRKLQVTRGRLIFNNVQVGDPGVDLRAEKEFDNVTAGVNVRGSLRAPRMTFYSEPTLPQSQIASIILAGGSLETAQNSGQQRAASSALLAQGGAILAQRYGSQVGIQDVAVETDLSNDTSLVLGRYLSPKLYVSYGISLAEAINTLKLRYTLGDHWTVKIESGSAQSADLEYTIRK